MSKEYEQLTDRFFHISPEKSVSAIYGLLGAYQNSLTGLSNYTRDFTVPFLLSTIYFNNAERNKLDGLDPFETIYAYYKLFNFNMDLFNRSMTSSVDAIRNYGQKEMKNAFLATLNTLFGLEGEGIDAFIMRQAALIDLVANGYPKAIKEIEPAFGFHFERGIHPEFAQTDRFFLYRVTPNEPGVTTDDSLKPVIILPPYVLGSNILAFLPDEKRSYAHAYANKRIPTYIRVLKNIDATEAVQLMTAEDDAADTRYFCEKVKAAHGGQPVTLNGYCQGGYSALCNILSGELDGLVDALITCVSPMDGTRSIGLGNFLRKLPRRFNDLAYGTKRLANGNEVADGQLMGWVYKLKSIEHESPVVAFYRDLMMFGRLSESKKQISKSAAAINYWLTHDRHDLPMGITKISFDMFNTPIAKDGTLPVTLFGKTLNLMRMAEKNIEWLICYGERDDLVEKETALAPLDWVDAEVTAFPKGHVAIATSWSHPDSECALFSTFGENNQRGPVKFQLDLNKSSGSGGD